MAMKQVSDTMRRKQDEAREFRRAFLLEFDLCMFCRERPATCVHEISNGVASRHKSIGERAACATACDRCNKYLLTDKLLWPPVKQLAAKALADPHGYDRCRLNVLRNTDPDAITEIEVIYAVVRLVHERLGERPPILPSLNPSERL